MWFSLSFFLLLDEIAFFLQILLQDKCNIGVLTVNIEFMWLCTKRMERLAKARLSPVSRPHHINSIFSCSKISNIPYNLLFVCSMVLNKQTIVL